MSDKAKAPGPRSTFPSMYAILIPNLVEIARELGYAIGLHGSMARDLDLIAVPWVEEAVPPEELVQAIASRLGFILEGPPRSPEDKPHGRRAWSLILCGEAYVDLSVLPLRPGGPA